MYHSVHKRLLLVRVCSALFNQHTFKAVGIQGYVICQSPNLSQCSSETVLQINSVEFV